MRIIEVKVETTLYFIDENEQFNEPSEVRSNLMEFGGNLEINTNKLKGSYDYDKGCTTYSNESLEAIKKSRPKATKIEVYDLETNYNNV